MSPSQFARRLSTCAAALVLAACADQSATFAPEPTLTALGATSVGEGQLVICKAGNAPGTFTFDWSVVTSAGAPVASGSKSVDVGQCEVAVQLPTTGSTRYRAMVTETAIPANWSLTSIGASYSSAVPSGWPTPVVDLAAGSISNVGMANDVGAMVTFTNTYTPPPPPPGGCTLTQGYWKTHNASFPGGAAPDPTWNLLPSAENTTFYLSGMTWYQVFNTAVKGNAYYNLAHQYMAAVLNGLNGASAPAGVISAMTSANTLFNTYTPAQVAGMAKNSTVYKSFGTLAETLVDYNEGVTGPGHCE